MSTIKTWYLWHDEEFPQPPPGSYLVHFSKKLKPVSVWLVLDSWPTKSKKEPPRFKYTLKVQRIPGLLELVEYEFNGPNCDVYVRGEQAHTSFSI